MMIRERKILRIFIIAILSLVCSVSVLNPIDVYADTYTFTDVTEVTDHYSDISWLSQNKITTGFNDGTFRPYDTVVRCDMAAFLRRIAKLWNIEDSKTWKPSESDYNTFIDINKDTDHAEDVLWLAHSGISEGWTVGNTKEFRPHDEITRCDMAAFITRLARKMNGKDASSYQASQSDKKAFTDVDSSTPHVDEILWMVHGAITEGFSNGNGTNRFEPYSNIVRCDMSAFLHRVGITKEERLQEAKKEIEKAQALVKTKEAEQVTAQSAYNQAVKDTEKAKSAMESTKATADAVTTQEFNSLKGLLETIANSDTIGEYTLTEQEKASAKMAIEALGELIEGANKEAASTTGDFYKVNIGGEGDATNLKQVLLSLDLIDELNDIRVNIEGLNELKVSLVLMTNSAMNANVEGYTYKHWIGGTQYHDMENAAWGYYKDSMTGWYTEEKAIWYGRQYIKEKGITKEEFQASTEYQKDFAEKYKDVNFANGWDSTMAAEWCRGAFNTGWDQTGHYGHCARIDGYAVGMALAEHSWTSVMQSASSQNYWFRKTPADDMTTDRLRQLITAFQAQIANAQTAYEKALAEYQRLQGIESTKLSELNAAKKAVEDAKSSLTKAQENYDKISKS